MNNFTDIILKNRLGEMNKAKREDFKRNMVLNEQLRKEYSFQENVDNVLKNSLLLESIENDPDLIKADILAKNDIDFYLGMDNASKGPQVGKSIFEIDAEVEMRKKIAKAEVEMFLSGIDVVSEVWVRNYNFNKKRIASDPAAQGIFNYIKNSLATKERVIQLPTWSHRISRRVGVGLAAAILVFSLFFVKSLSSGYSDGSIFERYYEPLEANSYSLRGNSQLGVEKLQEAIDLYLSKDYNSAELAFSQLGNQKIHQSEILLYRGLNKMQQDKYTDAIGFFTNLLANQDQFIPEAQWYLGLCYIKTGENQKAFPLLNALSQTEGLYKNKAIVILKNLKR